jgi:hypothetical protein
MIDTPYGGRKINRPELSRSEKGNLGTREIFKRIEEDLEKELPGSKFSIVTRHGSLSSDIDIALMDSDVKVVKDASEIIRQGVSSNIVGVAYPGLYVSPPFGQSHLATVEDIKKIQAQKTSPIWIPQYFKNEYDPKNAKLGIFLTREGYELFKKVADIVEYYNFDESDVQSDYVKVNFYCTLQLGRRDKPYRGQ